MEVLFLCVDFLEIMPIAKMMDDNSKDGSQWKHVVFILIIRT